MRHVKICLSCPCCQHNSNHSIMKCCDLDTKGATFRKFSKRPIKTKDSYCYYLSRQKYARLEPSRQKKLNETWRRLHVCEKSGCEHFEKWRARAGFTNCRCNLENYGITEDSRLWYWLPVPHTCPYYLEHSVVGNGKKHGS